MTHRKKAKAKGNGKSQHLGRTLSRRPAKNTLLGRFGRYLERRREEEGLTLRQVSERSKVPFSNVFQFECRGKNPRLTELEQLAHGYNQTLLAFLEPLLLSEVPPGHERDEHHVAVQ